LGSALQEILKEEGYDVYDIDVDITDGNAVKSVASEGSMDWIIHTAAMTNVNQCEKEQTTCYDVNVEGAKNVRDLAKKLGAKLLYISTVSVFSGKEGNYKETDVPQPVNFYNHTKREGEKAVLEYEKSLPEYLSQLPYLQNRPVIKKDVVLPIQGPIFCYCNRNQCLGMHNQENLECCCTPEKMRRMEEESCYVRATGEYISKLEYLQNIPENNSPDRFPYV